MDCKSAAFAPKCNNNPSTEKIMTIGSELLTEIWEQNFFVDGGIFIIYSTYQYGQTMFRASKFCRDHLMVRVAIHGRQVNFLLALELLWRKIWVFMNSTI
jgi:hypothetical protein